MLYIVIHAWLAYADEIINEIIRYVIVEIVRHIYLVASHADYCLDVIKCASLGLPFWYQPESEEWETHLSTF